MENLDNLSKLSYDEIKLAVIDTIIDNRLKKNTKDGYYILEFEESILDYCLQGDIPIDKNLKVMMMSDGFSCVSDRYNLIKEKDLLDKVATKGVHHIYNLIKNFEIEDINTTKYPRFKVHDDCSCIYLDIDFK